MELVEKPYFDDVFITNIAGKDLGLIMSALEEIPNLDLDTVHISTGVGKKSDISIWVSNCDNPILMRNRIFQATMRIVVEDYINQASLFDADNVWYPIFREVSLMGDEWYRLLVAVLDRYSKWEDKDFEPEYIVAKDLFDRYGEKLKNNELNLYELQVIEDSVFEDNTGWQLANTGLMIQDEDRTRVLFNRELTEIVNKTTENLIKMQGNSDEYADEEDYYIDDLEVDTIQLFA